MPSSIEIGAPTDTQPLCTITLTEPTVDFTAVTRVELLLRGNTTKPITKTSAGVGSWVGTWQYDGTFTGSAVQAWAVVHWADGSTETVQPALTFLIGATA